MEQASKQHSSGVSASVPVSGFLFLPWLPQGWVVIRIWKPNTPFSGFTVGNGIYRHSRN